MSDWSSDVCSSDLGPLPAQQARRRDHHRVRHPQPSDGRGAGARRAAGVPEIGSASCRERVCQYVEVSVVAVSFTKNKVANNRNMTHNNQTNMQYALYNEKFTSRRHY